MTISTLKIKAIGAVNQYRTRERERHKYILAVAGNNAGALDVPARTGFVYMRLRGEGNQVVEVQADASVPLDVNNPYFVEEIHRRGGTRYRIKAVAAEVYTDDPRANLPGRHGVEHERDDMGVGGSDPVELHPRAWISLRAQSQAVPDWTLAICEGWYIDTAGLAYHFAGGNSPTFFPPAAWGSVARRCDLLYFDAAHVATILQGTDITIDGSEPAQPTMPDPCTPIAFVYLDSTQTALDKETLIREPRLFIGSSGSAVGVPHDILSATHTDTTVSVPNDQDVLTWDGGTSAWIAQAPGAGSGDVVGPAGAVDENLASFDTNTGKLIQDSGIASADVVSAVADMHAQQHAITAIGDHTSGATPAQMLQADANGLPVDATNTDAEVDAAVGASHAQNTDTDLGALTPKNPPIDADLVVYRDSVAADALVTSTWTQIKAFLKTYFDTLYNLYVHPNHSGDVTSVGDGAQTIAAKAVTLAKMDDMATASLIYRTTAGAGAPEVNTLATLKTDLGSMPPAAHDIVSAHTYTGGTALDVFGLSGANTIAKLTPSSAPGAVSALLKSAADGFLTLVGFKTADLSITTNQINLLDLGNVEIAVNYDGRANSALSLYDGAHVVKTRLGANNDSFLMNKLGIGIAAPATSALLDLTATDGALLIPRMTTAQRVALTAVNGMLVYDATLGAFYRYENGAWTAFAAGGWGYPQDFRLTLTAALPVTTADVLAATVLYCTPNGKGCAIGLEAAILTSAEISIKATDAQTGTTHNGTKVIDGLTDTSQLIVGMLATGTGIGAAPNAIASIDTATQVTLSVNSTASATVTVTFKLPVSSVFDVFCFNNAGAPKLEWCAWTNTTTRATALVNHATARYLCKSGAETRRYLGTVSTTATLGQIEDSVLNRLVWNFYNRAARPLKITDANDSYADAGSAWRSWLNNTANRVTLVVGVQEDTVELFFRCYASVAGYAVAGIGLDAVNALATDCVNAPYYNQLGDITAAFVGFVGLGSHYLQLLEYGSAAGTFYGDGGLAYVRCGANGSVWG